MTLQHKNKSSDMDPKRPLEDWVRASFDKERDIPFDEGAWDSLSRKLDKGANRKKWLVILPWLISLFCALAAAYFYREAQIVRSNCRNMAQNLAPATILTDTLYLERSRVEYDTVFIAKNRPLKNKHLSERSPEASHPFSSPLSTPNQEVVPPAPPVPDQPAETALLPLFKQQRTGIRASWEKNVILLPTPAISDPGPGTRNRSPISRFWLAWETNGLALDKGSALDSNTVFTGNLGAVRSMVGIQWQVARWLRAHAGLGYEYAGFRSTTHRPFLPAPPADSLFSLQYPNSGWGQWESTQSALIYEIGVNLTPVNRDRIVPFLGFAITGRSGLTQRLNAELRTNDFPVDAPSTWVSANIRNRQFRFSGWKASAGVDYFHPAGWSAGLNGQLYGQDTHFRGLRTVWGLGVRLGWGF